MTSRLLRPFSLVTLLITMLVAPAYAQVHDNAKIFSADAVDKANTAMANMKAKHNKEFVLVTFAAVPADQQAALQQQGKSAFFTKWLQDQAAAYKVNGVLALVCMNPKYVEVGAGASTRARGDFTENDVTRLREQLQSDFHGGQFDQGLSNATDLVERAYTANIGGNEPAAAPSRAASPPVYPAFPGSSSSSSSHPGGFGLGLGSLICLGIGVLLIVSVIHSIFSRGGGGGYGGGGYGGGPGYPMGGGGYAGPGYGGGMGRSGGGFGSGLLGGLLGGAVGGYAADKWDHRNDGGGASGGGGSASFPEPSSGGGGGFDSGPSDAGQGFGAGSSGGDFGGGGGDSGGGGGGGGDSGGGF